LTENTASNIAAAQDVQLLATTILNGKNLPSGQFKVDIAYRIGSLVLVAGWRTALVPLKLFAGSTKLKIRKVLIPRQDVAAHFNLPSGRDIGFVIAAEYSGQDPICLGWQGPDEQDLISAPLRLTSQVGPDSANNGALGSAVGLLATAFPLNSSESRAILAQAPLTTSPCPIARGFLELAATNHASGDTALVGWLLHSAGSSPWLEDERGNCYTADTAFRRFRQDVLDAVGHEIPHTSPDSGFLLRIAGLKPGSTLRLKAVSELGVHTLSEIKCSELPADPVAAARWLFNIHTPLHELSGRMEAFDFAMIDPLLNERQAGWHELPVIRTLLGAPPAKPLVSIVIPLYGRTDFVEHQLIEFASDAWLLENAEIIYVLDDPRLIEPFTLAAQTLHRLYRVPFICVSGSVNRGFSGANNLGAAHAKGEYITFLNSDAFPQQAGWLEALVQVLKEHPSIGAVGPRLVFADGSIQHAGMQFLRREELGIWINHHPHSGLDPQLDPSKALTAMPSITGACLVMRRTDFDQVGQWDTGYLIGDFEDSDLCLKLKSVGLETAYLPTVQLTHLERQSFKLLGQDEFRLKVVIYNATRHQNRWPDLIQAQSAQAPTSAA